MNEELIFNIYWTLINLLSFAAICGFLFANNDDVENINIQLKENDYEDDYIDTFLP